MKEYTEEYAMWLEDALFKSLVKNKQISDKQLKTKLKNTNIEYVDEFVGYLLDINEENRIRSTIEFLDTYPVDLQADGFYDNEEEMVNQWEIDVIMKLLSRLKKEHKHITKKIYTDFFKENMEKYKPYFLHETYIKILPDNLFDYWFYRIDENIPYYEIDKRLENIAVNLTAMIESEYLNIDRNISSFNYLKDKIDC